VVSELAPRVPPHLPHFTSKRLLRIVPTCASENTESQLEALAFRLCMWRMRLLEISMCLSLWNQKTSLNKCCTNQPRNISAL